MGELRKIYDKDYHYLGYKKDRDLALESQEYVLVTGVFLIHRGRLLVTRRAQGKTYAHKWEITMGSVVEEESSLKGAIRELEEEVGVLAKEEDLKFLGLRREDQKFSEIYYLEQEIGDITLQEEEVEAYKFVDKEELDQMLRDQDFAQPMEERILAYYPQITKNMV